ncbi:MAG: hypoxanthine phosphoribosyltransferase [Actinomycetota bacterium]
MELGLFSLVVDDYDEAIRFYVEAVGFDLVEDEPAISSHDGTPKRWVVVRPPGAKTGILLAKASSAAQRKVVGNQVGDRVGYFLHTDDFDTDHKRMVAAGVRFLEDPRHETYGKVAVWEDLYGNRWDLVQPALDSPLDVNGSTGTAADFVPTAEVQPSSTVEPGGAFPPTEDVADILITTEQLQARIAELGATITADYAGRNPLLIAVLKGSMLFMADLMRAIDGPLEIDFLAVSSYGAATKSSGVVRIVKDLDQDVKGRDVIVVEDIVDTGLTLRYLLDRLSSQGPASLKTCSLLVREADQPSDVPVDYVGFQLPPEYVIGYGLDVDQQYRHLPYVARYAKA